MELEKRYIPKEVTEKILLKVPATDLIRLSCVSKSWNSTISDPFFVKRHLKRIGREKKKIRAYVDYRPYIENVVPALARPDGSPPNPWTDRAVIHATCNGLFCVQLIEDGSLFLCNPTTGKYKKLPYCSYSNPKQDQDKFVYGLGHDSIGDDYKVLVIPRRGGGDERWKEFYSVKSNSWKKMEGVGECVGRWGNDRLAFVGGALYWVDHRKAIAFLDLSTEEYGEVAAPEYPSPLGARDTVEVGAMKRYLWACVSYYEGTRFLLWLRRDGRWENFFNVDCPWLKPTLRYAMTPLHLKRKTKEIILHLYAPTRQRQSLSCLCIHSKSKAAIRKFKGSHSKIRNAYYYTQSLVSPAPN